MNSGEATVEDALKAADLHDSSIKDVRVNNVPVSMDDSTQLKEGAFVAAVGQVNGG